MVHDRRPSPSRIARVHRRDDDSRPGQPRARRAGAARVSAPLIPTSRFRDAVRAALGGVRETARARDAAVWPSHALSSRARC